MVGFLIVLLVLLGARQSGDASSGSGGSDSGSPPRPTAQGLSEFRRLAQAGGLTTEQADFLAFVAYGESGLQSDRGLGNPSLFPPGTRPNTSASASLQENEARAARRAYDGNRAWLEGCEHPESAYGFGSGGLFAFLPVYALSQFRGTYLQCASPYEVFDPAFSIAAAYGFARGLTRRSGFLGTWASLRSGWGLPSQMDNLQRIAQKSPKWRKHLRAVGLPESKLGAPAPSFPQKNLVDMYERIRAAQ